MFYILIFSLGLFIMMIVVTLYQRYSNKGTDEPQHADSNSHIIQLTDDTFDDTIKEGVSLVDFWAPWCGPCRSQMPIVTQIANERHELANICKINVDDHKKAAIKMKIKNIPNIIIFRDGVAVRQLIGSKPKHLIIKALDDTINESK